MVIKLIKHELRSIVRIAVIPAVVMILLAVISRLSLINYTGEGAIPFILTLFYAFALIATLMVSYFIGVSGFFKSLFTGNGYLTLSLPVTADQLIVSKLLASVITMLCGIAVCALSVLIFLIGLPVEELQDLGEIVRMFSLWNFDGGTRALVIFECVFLVLVSIPSGFLFFYAVMAFAQLFTVKNRRGIAIGLFIALIFVWSLLSPYVQDPIMEACYKVSVHLALWVEIAFAVVVAVGCYLLVRYILKNKVNLVA